MHQHPELQRGMSVIGVQNINEACDRLAEGDVKYRYSIDISTLKIG